MNIHEEGKYYASMVRKFHRVRHLLFLVSLQYEIRREIHTGYKCASA